MTTTTPATPTDAGKASFFATARKAFAGGTSTAIGTLAVSIPLAVSDGSISSGDVWIIAGGFVGGFAAGFAAVYSAKNASK